MKQSGPSESSEPHAGKCAQCPAFKLCSFRGIGVEILAHVERFKRPGALPADQVIASTGETLSGPICVGSGNLRAEFTGASGKRHLLRFFGPGDLAGITEGFIHAPLTYDLVTDTAITYCMIPAAELAQVACSCKPLSDEVMRRMSEEVQTCLCRTKLLMEKRADQRIAAALIEFQRLGRAFNRRELAEWAGTTVENVIRTLARFDREGLIRRNREKLRILDRKALESMAAL